MSKRLFVLLIMCSMMSGLVCSCGKTDEASAEHPITLTMWHNYGGDMQETMDTIIDEFNSTKGKEEGIIINVTAISSSSELNDSLEMIMNGDPGAPQMPDIFTGYPKIAVGFQEKAMLANLDGYFTKEEINTYVDDFVQEGRLDDGGLYVFPLAKSTEILYVNQTLFDQFAEATGAKQEDLSTFEGIGRLSTEYYKWSKGKQFFTADSWFNVAEVGMEQLGQKIFDADQHLNVNQDAFLHIAEIFLDSAHKGGVAVYDGYSSDLSKTGDLVCSTGSSAGILFYGDTITYNDGTTKKVEYSILPYPTFEQGKKIALQRGGGLMVKKTEKEREQAAALFIKWLTAPEQNMKFISSTGYLPVTKQAFEQEMTKHIGGLKDERVKKMLTAVLQMYKEYTFFSAPVFLEFDQMTEKFETDFRSVLGDKEVTVDMAVKKLQQ